jgi:hypothetical protein
MAPKPASAPPEETAAPDIPVLQPEPDSVPPAPAADPPPPPGPGRWLWDEATRTHIKQEAV